MPSSPRRSDEIDQHIDLVERVRKLEIMRSSRTLIPLRWKPSKRDLYTILGHALLIGCFDSRIPSNNSDEDTFPPGAIPVVEPASQYCWAYLDLHNFSNDAEAQDFTRFWQEINILPSVRSTSWIMQAPGTGPGSVAPQYGPALGPFMQGNYSGENAITRGYAWAGLPDRGEWIFRSSTDFGPDGNHYQNDSMVPLAEDIGEFSPTHLAIPAGTLRGSFGDDPITGRDNKYGFSNTGECGGPNEPTYDPYTYPGQAVLYSTGPTPCPLAPGGTAFFGGDIWRVALFLSAADLFLIAPPRMVSTAAQMALGDTFSFPQNAANLKIDDLLMRIELSLPYHPFVQAWYNRVIPQALDKQKALENQNWEPIRLALPWVGLVTAQSAQRKIILKGKATFPVYTSNVDDQMVIGRLSNNFPYAQGPTGQAHVYLAHTPGGEAVPVQVVFDPTNERTIIRLHTRWANAFKVAGRKGPLTLVFDGISIPSKRDPANLTPGVPTF